MGDFAEQLHHLPPTMAGVLFAEVFMRRFQATFSYVIWGKEFYGQQRHSEFGAVTVSCFF